MAPVDDVRSTSLYQIVVDCGAGGSCGTHDWKDVCVINELEEPKNDEGRSSPTRYLRSRSICEPVLLMIHFK